MGILEKGGAKPGDVVLVNGAAGAVGSVVGQIAKSRQSPSAIPQFRVMGCVSLSEAWRCGFGERAARGMPWEKITKIK